MDSYNIGILSLIISGLSTITALILLAIELMRICRKRRETKVLRQSVKEMKKAVKKNLKILEQVYNKDKDRVKDKNRREPASIIYLIGRFNKNPDSVSSVSFISLVLFSRYDLIPEKYLIEEGNFFLPQYSYFKSRKKDILRSIKNQHLDKFFVDCFYELYPDKINHKDMLISFKEYFKVKRKDKEPIKDFFTQKALESE